MGSKYAPYLDHHRISLKQYINPVLSQGRTKRKEVKMATEDAATVEGADPQISFKDKTSSDGMHSITMAESATVLDLKTKLSGGEFENVSVDRMRLIYSGRVMKDPEPLSTYKIKAGNTIHMVKSAQSNAAQNPASTSAGTGSAARAAPGVPTNMAAGTANNPLAGLTGARYAGHMGLPGMDMFGADGGMGAPPNEDQVAAMLDDPNIQQTMNEALQNPQMVDMMINSIPSLRNDPNARAMFNNPEFRRMLTNPAALRQAGEMRRRMQQAGVGSFPAPGATDTTPVQTPPAPGSAGQQTPQSPPTADPNAANPFASLFGGAGGAGQNPFGQMPPMTPEMMQQAMQMLQNGGMGNLFGGGNQWGAGGASSPPPPADTRPPEEIYADQLRQLNDMGFFDFDRNVAALRRSGGSVQGAIEQLLS